MRTLSVKISGIDKGYQSVPEGFRKDFAGKTKMGIYSYDSLYIERISGISVYFVIRWKIILNDKKNNGRNFFGVWKKMENGRVITSGHAS